MPYRRLPNTDKARLRALKTAFQAGKRIVPQNLAFSQKRFHSIEKSLQIFQQILDIKKDSYQSRISINKKFHIQQKKTKLYLSHFIQVFNMAIQRGELDKIERNYFDISENNSTIPEIQTSEDILYWGPKIILGEKERMKDGRNPIYNPKPALVKIEFEKFNELFKEKGIQTSIHEANSQKIKNIRSEIDILISKVWDDIEQYYSNLMPVLKRQNCSEYGVQYVKRTKEKLLKNIF